MRDRLCKCSECEYSNPDIIDRLTGKPFCNNWKTHMDAGCFHGLVEGYPDAMDGDVYWNPVFNDLWVVDSGKFIKINDGYYTDLDDPIGFVKVGHIDGITHKAVKI